MKEAEAAAEVSSQPAGQVGTGAARRARQRKQRCLAKRVQWLVQLGQASSSHHTACGSGLGGGGGDSSSALQLRYDSLVQRLTELEAIVHRLVPPAPAHAVSCQDSAQQGQAVPQAEHAGLPREPGQDVAQLLADPQDHAGGAEHAGLPQVPGQGVAQPLAPLADPCDHAYDGAEQAGLHQVPGQAVASGLPQVPGQGVAQPLSDLPQVPVHESWEADVAMADEGAEQAGLHQVPGQGVAQPLSSLPQVPVHESWEADVAMADSLSPFAVKDLIAKFETSRPTQTTSAHSVSSGPAPTGPAPVAQTSVVHEDRSAAKEHERVFEQVSQPSALQAPVPHALWPSAPSAASMEVPLPQAAEKHEAVPLTFPEYIRQSHAQSIFQPIRPIEPAADYRTSSAPVFPDFESITYEESAARLSPEVLAILRRPFDLFPG